MTFIKNHVNGYSHFIKCTNFDPYLMAMHVRTEGDKLVFSSAKFETFANLVWVKATYHYYFSIEN